MKKKRRNRNCKTFTILFDFSHICVGICIRVQLEKVKKFARGSSKRLLLFAKEIMIFFDRIVSRG